MPSHRDSLTRWPTWSAFGLSCRVELLDRRQRHAGTAAIAPSVSPALTTYTVGRSSRSAPVVPRRSSACRCPSRWAVVTRAVVDEPPGIGRGVMRMLDDEIGAETRAISASGTRYRAGLRRAGGVMNHRAPIIRPVRPSASPLASGLGSTAGDRPAAALARGRRDAQASSRRRPASSRGGVRRVAAVALVRGDDAARTATRARSPAPAANAAPRSLDPPALGADAGQQEDRVRHQRAQPLEPLRRRRADDRADVGEPAARRPRPRRSRDERARSRR